MQSGSKEEKPSIPDTWGTLPTQPHEVIDTAAQNYMVYRRTINGQGLSTNASTGMSPMEEYLEMTKRLIESNSLSPRNTAILKELYARYESMKNYGPAAWDGFDAGASDAKPLAKDKTKKIGETGLTDKSLIQTSMQPKMVATVKYQEKPSTSETMSMESGYDQFEEKEKDRISTMSSEEAELYWIKLQTVRDPDFDRPCDPEKFEINNVFSDFSMRHVGHETTLKKSISQLIISNKKQSASSPEKVTPFPRTQHSDEDTETDRQKGRLDQVSEGS